MICARTVAAGGNFVAPPLYLDTSAILQAVLEQGARSDFTDRVRAADALIVSRLVLVEAARALLRLRREGTAPEAALAEAGRDLDALFARCEVWELTAAVCDLAATLAPDKSLRTLDALHLATWLTARRRLGDVELLTADQRMRGAAGL